jgi:hypothetical protein
MCRLQNLLILLLLLRLTQGEWSGPYCENNKLPIVLLHRNSTTGEFTFVKRASRNEMELTEGHFRLLEAEYVADASLRQRWIPGLLADEERNTRVLQGDFPLNNEITGTPETRTDETTVDGEGGEGILVSQNITDEFFYARECSCFKGLYPTSYCPFTVEICQQRFSVATHPGYLTSPPHLDRTKLLLCVVIASYWCIRVFLLFTKYGHSFFDYYLISLCVPGWSRRRIDQLMRNDPDRTRLLIRGYVLRQQRGVERIARENAHQQANLTEEEQPDNNGQPVNTQQATIPEEQVPTRKPTSLSLRTRLYSRYGYHQKAKDSNKKGDDNDGDDDDDEVCTICFAPLLDGDHVGELPCDHVFHVECLKMWLPRKNVCPLCQTKEVARPLYDEDLESTDLSSVLSSSVQPET